MSQSRTDRTNAKIAAIHRAIPISRVQDIPNLADILGNHHRVQGLYARMHVADLHVSVPDVASFQDRGGNDYHKEAGQFDAPLLTLEQWRAQYKQRTEPTPNLLVNANWFNFWHSGVSKRGKQMNLRTTPRTFLVGLSMFGGKVVSSHNKMDRGRIPLDTIFFNPSTGNASIFCHAKLTRRRRAYMRRKKASAVSGFATLINGHSQRAPDHIMKHYDVARTAIGILPDKKTVIVMVVEDVLRRGGISVYGITKLLQSLGCTNVINLDGGGSAELLYRGANVFGQDALLHTTTSDRTDDPDNYFSYVSDTERPKPNCIGFSITSPALAFACDDADLPRPKQHDDQKDRAQDDFNVTYLR